MAQVLPVLFFAVLVGSHALLERAQSVFGRPRTHYRRDLIIVMFAAPIGLFAGGESGALLVLSKDSQDALDQYQFAMVGAFAIALAAASFTLLLNVRVAVGRASEKNAPVPPKAETSD